MNVINNDWDLYCKIAKEEPHKEHTELQTVNSVLENPEYISYDYSDRFNQLSNGNIVLTCKSKKQNSNLKVVRLPKRAHQLIVAHTGAGKTQGAILNEALNMDGKTSYIFTDPKGEVTQYAYSYAVQVYGEENVAIANFMQPQYSTIRMNPLAKLAKMWVTAQSRSSNEKKKSWDYILTEIRKFVDVAFIEQSQKDPTWEHTAKTFIFSTIVGMFEDLTLTDEEVKKVKRPRILPNQINIETLSRIINSFSWDRKFDDKGFLSSRSINSIAYQQSKALRENAPTTRANYMQFVENYLKQYLDPKITEMSEDNTFEIESMTETPKVLFLIYDLSDINVREWVNIIVADSLQELMAYSHKIAQPFKTPIVVVCDEFPTLQAHIIYPTVFETGRGVNLFMVIAVQSLSQLKAQYPKHYNSIIENCSVKTFLGTNDVSTAKDFIENMGKTTVPSMSAYLDGRYSSEIVDIVTIDDLMHRLLNGQTYICIDRSMPIHGQYCLYYQTEEYLKYPQVKIRSHRFKDGKAIKKYDTKWMTIPIKDDEDDDDDFPF